MARGWRMGYSIKQMFCQNTTIRGCVGLFRVGILKAVGIRPYHQREGQTHWRGWAAPPDDPGAYPKPGGGGDVLGLG